MQVFSSQTGLRFLCIVLLLNTSFPPSLNLTYGSLVPPRSRAAKFCPLLKVMSSWYIPGSPEGKSTLLGPTKLVFEPPSASSARGSVLRPAVGEPCSSCSRQAVLGSEELFWWDSQFRAAGETEAAAALLRVRWRQRRGCPAGERGRGGAEKGCGCPARAPRPGDIPGGDAVTAAAAR